MQKKKKVKYAHMLKVPRVARGSNDMTELKSFKTIFISTLKF